jgi:hypothetical protein
MLAGARAPVRATVVLVRGTQVTVVRARELAIGVPIAVAAIGSEIVACPAAADRVAPAPLVAVLAASAEAVREPAVLAAHPALAAEAAVADALVAVADAGE